MLCCCQLSSLYDSKPPVSRAKMASITKTALKAVKFYKHVVQSVEKFILKVCSSIVKNTMHILQNASIFVL